MSPAYCVPCAAIVFCSGPGFSCRNYQHKKQAAQSGTARAVCALAGAAINKAEASNENLEAKIAAEDDESRSRSGRSIMNSEEAPKAANRNIRGDLLHAKALCTIGDNY